MAGYQTLLLGILVGCVLVSVEGGAFSCRSEGRFPHPEDCGAFVDCYKDGSGNMLMADRRCFGFPYSPEKKKCVTFEEKPDCTPKASKIIRMNPIPISTLDYRCEEENAEDGCHHCYLGYTCIGKKAYVTLCENGESCSDSSSFKGYCLPYSVTTFTKSECTCNGVDLYGDYYNMTYYHFCDANQNKLLTYECPYGEKFVDGVGCKAEEPTTTPATPTCQGIGSKVNPQNCQFYYTCLPDGLASVGSCNTAEFFEEDSSTCVDKCSFIETTTTPSPICTQAGIVKDPTDCTKYHLCLAQDDLMPYKSFDCPPETFFDVGEASCVSEAPAGCLVEGFDYTQCPGFGLGC